MLPTQVIYKKGLEDEIDVQAPKLLGEKGVRSPAYLALNPQGKMPMMVLPDGTSLPESQVCVAGKRGGGGGWRQRWWWWWVPMMVLPDGTSLLRARCIRVYVCVWHVVWQRWQVPALGCGQRNAAALQCPSAL